MTSINIKILTRMTACAATVLALVTGCANRAASPDIQTFITAHPTLYLEKTTEGDPIRTSDIMVLNGPLFDGHGDPVGGYISRYGDAAPSVRPFTQVVEGDGNFAWRNQIFGLRADGSFFMRPFDPSISADELLMRERVVFAIQNGPALVAKGKNLHDSNSRHTASRIGLGYTSDNRLIVADSQDAITMYDLAEALRRQGAVEAIYLDGNRNGWLRSGQERGTVPREAMLLHIQ